MALELDCISIQRVRAIGLLIADRLDRDPRRTLDVSNRAYVIAGGEVLGTLSG